MTSGTGTCTVHYNQAGDANYNAAPEVTEERHGAEGQPDHHGDDSRPGHRDVQHDIQRDGDGVVRTRCGDHGQAACAAVQSGGTNAATILMTSGTGTCTVHYNQAGDANYNAAPEVTEGVTAQKANQTITVDDSARRPPRSTTRRSA